MTTSSSARVGIQKFGSFLSGMVMPNIAAFIAWGLITAFFHPNWMASCTWSKPGWTQMEMHSTMVD